VPEAPKSFWILAGIALIVIAGALAFRILNPNQSVQVAAGEGLSISLDTVQQNIDAAQQSVTQFQQEAAAQQNEIAQLEARIGADQNEIRNLVAEIKGSPTAPPALKSSAEGLLNSQASRPLPTIRTVDPKLLEGAQLRLNTASKLATELMAQKK
jgi:septal ring factor EnvC (AmiA/AmiB activator)